MSSGHFDELENYQHGVKSKKATEPAGGRRSTSLKRREVLHHLPVESSTRRKTPASVKHSESIAAKNAIPTGTRHVEEIHSDIIEIYDISQVGIPETSTGVCGYNTNPQFVQEESLRNGIPLTQPRMGTSTVTREPPGSDPVEIYEVIIIDSDAEPDHAHTLTQSVEREDINLLQRQTLSQTALNEERNFPIKENTPNPVHPVVGNSPSGGNYLVGENHLDEFGYYSIPSTRAQLYHNMLKFVRERKRLRKSRRGLLKVSLSRFLYDQGSDVWIPPPISDVTH
ncbi:hypothetical protein JCM33374_g2456 [Metschnikowia sp. JCM 33374]|nr:hypothetical protein JCM33374_g2456 [Metschnikowia sp. JCM 33374]